LEESAQKALEDAEADEAEAEENEIPEEWVWTPEAVAKSIEGIIRHGAHLIRRARWFCLLSESSLAWNTGETAGGSRRLLILRGGGVAHREDLAGKKKIPPPPGYLRPFPVRRQNFDVITYDRMRVFTTELRRLVTGETDREVELRLSPTNVLKRENLAKALQWI
ncbi:MAG: hypothetical protein GY950_26310, partial [bacterium]|nr:hypothetical protein [bacterium]